MRINAAVEASVREAQLGALRFDDTELSYAQALWSRRVMRMVDRLLDEIEQRERLLLLCTK